ncbi:hypothetical protein EVA_19793 [gut metagenome]|uniref:Uncharacterized protein n=1 Tax=gut metagenome TaxID=749906 RepID=J9FRB7_9ZZZZ
MTKAAKRANGLSQACTHCPVLKKHNICPPEISRICHDAYVEGFKKGVKWVEQKQKEE